MSQAQKNISKVLEQADTHDRQSGLVAYQMYHECLRGIASHYGTGFCQTVAAFAALSPNNDYTGNLRSLVSLIRLRYVRPDSFPGADKTLLRN